jgi:hypothetical protein
MRSNQSTVARGEKARSDIKKEVAEAKGDQGWKGDAMKQQEAEAKAARAPGSGQDRDAGLSVPRDRQK